MVKKIVTIEKYLLPYQKIFFMGIFGIALLGFLYTYLLSLLIVKPVWKQPALQDLKNCQGVLCNIRKEVMRCENVFCIMQLILSRNIQAQGNILLHNFSKPKYLFTTPFIAAWQEGKSLGPLLYMKPKEFLLGALLPHGIIELFVGYLTGSLFYSGLIAIINMIFKKTKLTIKNLLMIIFVQITVILVLYTVAALLESIPIGIKMNIL